MRLVHGSSSETRKGRSIELIENENPYLGEHIAFKLLFHGFDAARIDALF